MVFWNEDSYGLAEGLGMIHSLSTTAENAHDIIESGSLLIYRKTNLRGYLLSGY